MPDKDIVTGLFESGTGEWIQIIVLVFGGCCSNVWALESMLKEHPNAGSFLTFAQFLYITLQNLSAQLVFPKDVKTGEHSWIPRPKQRAVPIRRWMVQVLLVLGVNLMNNYALGMKIPMTVHIIFRSGGLCVSMIVGYLIAGKRYSMGQILAGVMITVGIVIATTSAPRKRGAHDVSASAQNTDSSLYLLGVGLLSVALVISSLLGLWQEGTYARYGKQWREGLFYSHFLSLPFFLPMYSAISSSTSSFVHSKPVNLFVLPPSARQNDMLGIAKLLTAVTLPSALVALAINVVTQGICIRGVNRLTARVNSTTVNLVLTLRKAVSLAISVWFYGSGVTSGLLLGGALVLVGTVIYSFASTSSTVAVIKPVEPAENGTDSEGKGKASGVESQGNLRQRKTIS
ncbi:UAA transporter [Kockovaella imperatae]|uniref:UAA transporter n=1 Tax=Kockovaella imperatae TaxID=4999 RepID=A0A1Y1UKY8_9TREE|nr:UAA transporter [Kockovaella imperatae]ORX37785.1 UAA transporter [Kockovaella imperatae]